MRSWPTHIESFCVMDKVCPLLLQGEINHCQNVNLVLMILQYQGVYNAYGKETLTTRKLYQNN